MTALLDARDVSVSYGKLNAVKGVSFAIEASKIVTIIGPNGAGKTTLLKALMGQLPCQGDVRFMGDGIASSPVEERVRARHHPGSGNARALHRHAGRRQPDARRLRASTRSGSGQAGPDNVYALFPRLRERRAQRRVRCRAASARCWRSGAP
jgi:branched-chain amino acid transport system ATP-binding protein